jgi:hypothetical protein
MTWPGLYHTNGRLFNPCTPVPATTRPCGMSLVNRVNRCVAHSSIKEKRKMCKYSGKYVEKILFLKHPVSPEWIEADEIG